MGEIDISGIDPVKELFHNVWIDTYPTTATFDQIDYWPGNLRTLLAFDRIKSETNKNLENIPLKELTEYLASRSELQLDLLASSIKTNGVRVPLIVLTDGRLLDGNRRYFACSYLYHNNNEKIDGSVCLNNIPIKVIQSDISYIKEQKILAEANFVSDYKVPWTDDVRAYVVSEFFQNCISEGMSEGDAFVEIKNVYGIMKSDALAYIDTIRITDKFVSRSRDKQHEYNLKELVLTKFVYFWEFRNKATKGRGALNSEEMVVVLNLFYQMMETGRFRNIKQIEPMIRAFHDEELWEILVDSEGEKIDQVVLYTDEKKIIKSAEDKVRNFIRWLDKENTSNFTRATFSLLESLADKIKGIT